LANVAQLKVYLLIVIGQIKKRIQMTNLKSQSQISNGLLLLITLCCSPHHSRWAGANPNHQTKPKLPHLIFQSVIARQAALVTEFDVNGLKVLVKRARGSLTVAAQLYFPRRCREHQCD